VLNLKTGAMYFDASVPSVIWALTIEMYDSTNASQRISFSVQDLHNSKDSLIKKGFHCACGQGNDAISNHPQK